jgi:hypothetical protein
MLDPIQKSYTHKISPGGWNDWNGYLPSGHNRDETDSIAIIKWDSKVLGHNRIMGNLDIPVGRNIQAILTLYPRYKVQKSGPGKFKLCSSRREIPLELTDGGNGYFHDLV